jgi:hypothetical protein
VKTTEAKHASRSVDKQHIAAEIVSANASPSRSGSHDINDVASQTDRGFNLLIVLREIDILADELAKLAPSMDRTALELRLAQMRQVVELQHNKRANRLERD